MQWWEDQEKSRELFKSESDDMRWLLQVFCSYCLGSWSGVIVCMNMGGVVCVCGSCGLCITGPSTWWQCRTAYMECHCTQICDWTAYIYMHILNSDWVLTDLYVIFSTPLILWYYWLVLDGLDLVPPGVQVIVWQSHEEVMVMSGEINGIKEKKNGNIACFPSYPLLLKPSWGSKIISQESCWILHWLF